MGTRRIKKRRNSPGKPTRLVCESCTTKLSKRIKELGWPYELTDPTTGVYLLCNDIEPLIDQAHRGAAGMPTVPLTVNADSLWGHIHERKGSFKVSEDTRAALEQKKAAGFTLIGIWQPADGAIIMTTHGCKVAQEFVHSLQLELIERILANPVGPWTWTRQAKNKRRPRGAVGALQTVGQSASA